MRNTYTVYTPAADFSGYRNAGRQSAEFIDGKAERVSREQAEYFVRAQGYFCPEIYPEHKYSVKPVERLPQEMQEKIALVEPQEGAGSGAEDLGETLENAADVEEHDGYANTDRDLKKAASRATKKNIKKGA